MFVLAALLAPAAPLHGQPTPQVTTEIPCTSDSQCPTGAGVCGTFPWWPGCGCDRSAGRCHPNPRRCTDRSECFGREICSHQGTCAEPGPGVGAPCNNSTDCVDWLLCDSSIGTCAQGACAVNGDCAAGQECFRGGCRRPPCDDCSRPCPTGQVCRIGSCAPAPCDSDAKCGGREICRAGACTAVECRTTADCRGCQICTSENTCFALCSAKEECVNVNFNILHRSPQFECVDRATLRCNAGGSCPVGEVCLGGSCALRRELRCADGGTACPPGELCVERRCRSVRPNP
jgi:hypothetical protein